MPTCHKPHLTSPFEIFLHLDRPVAHRGGVLASALLAFSPCIGKRGFLQENLPRKITCSSPPCQLSSWSGAPSLSCASPALSPLCLVLHLSHHLLLLGERLGNLCPPLSEKGTHLASRLFQHLQDRGLFGTEVEGWEETLKIQKIYQKQSLTWIFGWQILVFLMEAFPLIWGPIAPRLS